MRQHNSTSSSRLGASRADLLTVLIAVLLGCGFLGACGDSDSPSVQSDNNAENNDADAGNDVDDRRDVVEDRDTRTDMGEPDATEDEPDVVQDVADATDDAADATQECDCQPGEICVSNDSVQNECFPRDCDDTQCESEQVCYQGECTVTSCAGVDCGGYPSVCRGGQCVIGSCSDPDVNCPDGLSCVDDECREPCQLQVDCAPLACIDGFCRICNVSIDCGPGLICVAEQCVQPCTEDPELCRPDEVCNENSGACIPRCTSDDMCDGDLICNTETGRCVQPECTEEGVQGECNEGELCLNRRCQEASPRFFGNLCSGCARMESARYVAIGTVAPVEIVGSVATSGAYRLESGAIIILRESER